MSKENVGYELRVGPSGMGIDRVVEKVALSQFTDGAGTDGTYALKTTIPAGSFVLGTQVDVLTAFAGDTTAVMDVGDGSDADAFSYTTFNVFTAAKGLMEAADGVSGGSTGHGVYLATSETTVTLTVTGGSSFAAITAGELVVAVYYFDTSNLS